MKKKRKKKRTKKKKKALSIKKFQGIIWNYYHAKGRHDLLWRRNITPYRVLISEVMLQQTQVSRATEYFPRFLHVFPDIASLADATQPEVLTQWQGLGYNRRALFLHKAAKQVMHKHGGELPANREALEELPGIGPATSGALMSSAFNQPVVFIETNIRRVFLHHFFPDREEVLDKEVLKKVEEALPKENIREWYWALMDYGAMLPKKLKRNPNKQSRHYTKQSKFEGSVREVRGAIVRRLLDVKSETRSELQKALGFQGERFESALKGMKKEGLIESVNKKIRLKT